MSAIVRLYAQCPWCEKDSGRRCDHIKGREAGSWSCEECGAWFTVSEANGVYSCSKNNSPVWPRMLSLLRVDEPFFMIMSSRNPPGDTDQDLQHSRAFYFEEHSCPTNWWRNAEEIITLDADNDPHGIAKHIRTVEVPDDFDASTGYSGKDYAIYSDLFPELPSPRDQVVNG